MDKALEWFSSPVIAAHWGGVGCGEGVLKHLAGKNIYFDTSYAYGTQPKFYFEKILEKHGADRLLFGTDTPWHTADMELRLLKSLNIGEEDMEKITHKNAEKILGI
jgi:predicted TIM-barrel fold metal-dependent hydrolase